MSDPIPFIPDEMNETIRLTKNLVPLPERANGSSIEETEETGAGRCVPVKLVIGQSEPIFCDSLRTLLQGAGFEVVGGGSDMSRSLALVRKNKPDILLLDMSMAYPESTNGQQVLKECMQHCKVIVIGRSVASEEIVRFLQLGVRGFVMRSEPSHALFDCIVSVARGEYWLGQEAITSLIQAVVSLAGAQHKIKNKYGLTRRESEIILAVLEGFSNPEIAAQFALSEQTVKHHVSHIFDKLGVYSRVELALFAVKHGFAAE